MAGGRCYEGGCTWSAGLAWVTTLRRPLDIPEGRRRFRRAFGSVVNWRRHIATRYCVPGHTMVDLQRDIFQGLVLLRILHAASLDRVSGVEVSAQLEALGHRVSPGTLYPLLHRMEKTGWLKSAGKTVRSKYRRYYRITKRGREALHDARPKLSAFVAGIIDSSPSSPEHTDRQMVARTG
jgi:PadR family transcriptional regulator PadR